MEDKEIIELYFARSEQAIKETDSKYRKYCYGIAYHILENQESSEECVNDAYLRTWNVIPPQKPTNLRAFIGKITRNLALSKYRADHRHKRGGGCVEIALEELQEAASCLPPEAAILEAELIKIVESFLENLTPRARVFFVQRYWYLSSIKEIAAENKVSIGIVKMSLLRSRKELKKCLEKEGISV